MVKLLRAAGALSVLVALLVGVPVLLVRWVGNPNPPGGLAALGIMSDTAVLGLLAALAWLFWIQLTACVLWEVAAALRGVPAARLPIAHEGQQRVIRALVHTVVAAGVTGAALTAGGLPAADGSAGSSRITTAPGSGNLGPATHLPEIPTHPPAQHHAPTQPDPAATPSVGATNPTTGGATVTVTTGDTLWGLAERHLGAGERWREIADMNLGRDMGDGRFSTADTLRVGWVLRLPGDAAGGHPGTPPGADGADERWVTTERRETVEVRSGDSLWALAEDQLDDPRRWPQMYEANRAVIGDDPDVILPGQVLRLPDRAAAPAGGPGTQASGPQESDANQGDTNQADTNRVDAKAPHRGDVTVSDPHTRDDDGTAAPTDSKDDIGTEMPGEEAGTTESVPTVDDNGDDRGVTALRALLASAVCLSGGALAILMLSRRRQFRERRCGRAIAVAPPDLVGVERAIVEAGADAMDATEFIDLALRHLAASQRVTGRELPNLGAVVLSTDELSVLFTAPPSYEPPEGWTEAGDGAAWILPRRSILEPELGEQPAPYPGLVSVGVDAEDRTWLLDLEACGNVAVTGPGAGVEDLVRFMVAELALNAWAEGAEVVLTDGFADEAVGLNPARVRSMDGDRARRLGLRIVEGAQESVDNVGASVLDLRRDAVAVDGTGPCVIVVRGQSSVELADAVRGRDRSRLVLIGHEGAPTAQPVIELTTAGLAHLPDWGVTLDPFTLPAEASAAMADLMVTMRGRDRPMPPSEGQSPRDAYLTVDGALRPEHTRPRVADHADVSSVLPEPDEAYVSAAATTPEDLAALGPAVPPSVPAEIEALDPGLDDDVAAWRDPAARRPRVQVLGPVAVEAWGTRPEDIANLGGTTEFIVFLACQDHGVTPERAAVALGWSEATIHNRARDARRLLGDRSDGHPWLPEATKTTAARQRGVATYELHPEVLVAANLFRRLRCRGQARGAAGLEDLVSALSLVSGRPFDHLRRRGYGWLVETPLDHYLSHAVVDLAHIIVNRALAEGDAATARWACQIAILAAPDEDTPRLDLAAINEADGTGPADQVVADQVLDCADADPTARTEQVINQRGWLAG